MLFMQPAVTERTGTAQKSCKGTKIFPMRIVFCTKKQERTARKRHFGLRQTIYDPANPASALA